VPSHWKRHLGVGKGLNLVPHYIDSSFIGRVQFQHALLVCIAQESMSQTEDASSFSDSRCARNDNMRTVAIASNHFKTFDGFGIARDVIQDDRPILLDPEKLETIPSFIQKTLPTFPSTCLY